MQKLLLSWIWLTHATDYGNFALSCHVLKESLRAKAVSAVICFSVCFKQSATRKFGFMYVSDFKTIGHRTVWFMFLFIFSACVQLPLPGHPQYIIAPGGLVDWSWFVSWGVLAWTRYPHRWLSVSATLIARSMKPTWGPSGADRTQVGPMLVPRTLLSGSRPVAG